LINASFGPMLLFTVVVSTIVPAGDAQRFRRSLRLSCTFAACLWLVKIIEAAFGFDFSHFGIYPGSVNSLSGILLAPLIHGSWSHLASNTTPVVVLGTALLYGYPRSTKITLPLIYLGSGCGVWLFARETYHIGAIGMTFGMMFFVFTIGSMRWDRRAIALSMIVFFLYGGMIWGIFPQDPGISFENHFIGAAIGVALAAALKNIDPAPPEKHYSWEDEELNESDEPSDLDR
jgi:membrane associated rhomboid family serine protease